MEDDIVDGSNGNATVLEVLKEDALDVICKLDEGEIAEMAAQKKKENQHVDG